MVTPMCSGGASKQTLEVRCVIDLRECFLLAQVSYEARSLAKVSVLYAATNPFCVGRGMSHGGNMDVGLEGSSIGLRP